MIWILLAALGIPLWMVVGALVTTLWSRRRFQQASGTFPAKVRVVSGDVDGLTDSWQRRPILARWTHDVLVMQRGLALVRTDVLGVARSTSLLEPPDPDAGNGMGDQPLMVSLESDNGATLQLAAPAESTSLLVGPFAVAQISDSFGARPGEYPREMS